VDEVHWPAVPKKKSANEVRVQTEARVQNEVHWPHKARALQPVSAAAGNAAKEARASGKPAKCTPSPARRSRRTQLSSECKDERLREKALAQLRGEALTAAAAAAAAGAAAGAFSGDPARLKELQSQVSGIATDAGTTLVKAAEQLCDQRSWIHMGCATPTMVQGWRLCCRQPMQPAHLDVESTQIGRRRRSLETSRHRARHDGVQMKVVHCTALPSIDRGPICVLSQYRVSALVCHKLAHFLVAQTTDCVQAK